MTASVLPFAALAGLLWLGAALQDPDKRPEEAAKVPAGAIARLGWLSGTWELRDGAQVTEEHWRPLQGTTLLGSSHTYDQKRTLAFEHLRIAAMRGTVAYVAMPGGAAPTVFLATKVGDAVAEFENGKHDFPQRIRYEKTAAGVTATISLLDGSRAQSFVFTKK